ncbi:MAG: M15 family metallopeptidase, partial [Ruthenibacterium sp.]
MSGSAATAPAAAIVGPEWNMVLVNAQNPLPEGFAVTTRDIKGYEHRAFDARAADDLERLLTDAEKAGCPLYLVSAYRSSARQAALFKRKVQAFMTEGFDAEEAERQAAQWVARPYTSEHNLGLAADIVSADWYRTNNDLTAMFDKTPHFAWLQQHCADYGFILRYPPRKEKITGVRYEPWHYRYVGVKAAKSIMDSGLTLEEYCA